LNKPFGLSKKLLSLLNKLLSSANKLLNYARKLLNYARKLLNYARKLLNYARKLSRLMGSGRMQELLALTPVATDYSIVNQQSTIVIRIGASRV
jgi:hypothetical protein